MRRSPTRRAALTVGLLAALSACDLTQFCPAEEIQPRGNLDRLADMVLVTPPGQEDPARSFLVLANPEIEQLRIYDAFDGAFLFAPNVFFPLSIRTGPATRQLAAPARVSSRVVALDGALSRLLLVRTVDEAEEPAWTVVGEVPTAPAPADVAVVAEGERLRAFVALPDESAVQVLSIDPETAEATEVARIDLGEGSRPGAVSVDPTGATLVVADAALPSLALVRTDELTVTRLDVGAPSSQVVTGRVDVGDGLAPVALALLRGANAVAAVRLFREGFREDRYALLGSVELPAVPAAAFVPDAGEGETAVPVCCGAIAGVASPTGAVTPTAAWGAVVTATGSLLYVRLDGLVELIDAVEGQPSPVAEGEEFIAPEGGGGDALRPTLATEAIENYGVPPRVPFFPPDLTYTFTYEGTPPGAADVDASFADGTVTVTGGGPTLEARGVDEGDLIVVETAGRGGTCPEEVEGVIQGLEGNTFTLQQLSSLEVACLEQGGGFTFTAFATGDLLVESSEAGFLGRVFLPPPDEGAAVVEVPGLRFSITASPQGLPLRGSQLVVPISQNLQPVGIELSQEAIPNAAQVGFESAALLATSMAGGEILVEVPAEQDGDPSVERVRRMWLATGAGLLLEMNQAENDIDDVLRLE